MRKKGNKFKVFSELFYVYKGKEIQNTYTETISESEPTVLQFETFLSKLENSAIRKLVIVFDNMDRLPAAKVKEIWSSYLYVLRRRFQRFKNLGNNTF